jgi:hypothetical protein
VNDWAGRARRIAAAWPLLVPVLLAAVLYARGFQGFWLGDDLPNLHRTHEWSQAGRLWSDTLRQFLAPITGGGSFIRPMMIATLSLNYEIAGARYAGWYALNFAVHLANVALLVLVILGFARRLRCEGRGAAFVAALVFGLNPLISEGVYWISARSDQWVALCSLAAIAAWIRDDREGTSHGVWAYPLLLVVALGFKESAAVLPLQMALLALAWPSPRPRGMAFAAAAGLGVMVLYFAFRMYLFGSFFETYLGAPGQTWIGAIERVRAGVHSLPGWWSALAHARPSHAALYPAALAVGLVVALASTRSAGLRLALAAIASSAGMVAATLHSLGNFASNGEGGRLLYGPVAWLALGLGLLLVRAAGERSIAWKVACGLALLAALAGAGILQSTIRQVTHAQQGSRALVAALAQLASSRGSLSMVIVPENQGSTVLYRNGQGGLVLPPVQERPILHRVIPSLPRDIPVRYDQFARGLAKRVDETVPANAEAATLKKLLVADEARWPPVLCWQPGERRLVELPLADSSRRDRWIGQTRAAARACLPDEPTFAEP